MTDEHASDDPQGPESSSTERPGESATSGPSSPSNPAPETRTVTPQSQDSVNLAMLAHLLGIVTGFIAPLIIWLLKKDEDFYVNDQAKEALNFQLIMLIALVISNLSIFIFIGCVLFPAVVIADIVLCIMAGVAASRGEQYRYPVMTDALRFIK